MELKIFQAPIEIYFCHPRATIDLLRVIFLTGSSLCTCSRNLGTLVSHLPLQAASNSPEGNNEQSAGTL
jgi:hypothetical protein